MPNSNRQRGDYLERQTRSALEACGWIVVRAAGSLGVADLVALRRGNRPLLVSCKLGKGIPPHERLALLDASTQAGARPVMATRTKRGVVDIHLVRAVAPHPLIDQIRVPARPGKPTRTNCGACGHPVDLDDPQPCELGGLCRA
jgi:Holliday junction resolvase